MHISIHKQCQYHPKFHLKSTVPALITKSRFHFVFYLSDSISWHLLGLVLSLNFYGSRLQFKSIYGKWAWSQITFQLLRRRWGCVVTCHWPGFLVPCFYSEELYKSPFKIPGKCHNTVFSENSFLFLPKKRGLTQISLETNSIWFGLVAICHG